MKLYKGTISTVCGDICNDIDGADYSIIPQNMSGDTTIDGNATIESELEVICNRIDAFPKFGCVTYITSKTIITGDEIDTDINIITVSVLISK